jgi:hypothetical protein
MFRQNKQTNRDTQKHPTQNLSPAQVPDAAIERLQSEPIGEAVSSRASIIKARHHAFIGEAGERGMSDADISTAFVDAINEGVLPSLVEKNVGGIGLMGSPRSSIELLLFDGTIPYEALEISLDGRKDDNNNPVVEIYTSPDIGNMQSSDFRVTSTGWIEILDPSPAPPELLSAIDAHTPMPRDS